MEIYLSNFPCAIIFDPTTEREEELYELDKQMKDACLVLLENDKTKKRLPPLGNDRRRIKIKRSNRAELNKTMDCWKPYIQTLFAPLR